MRKKGDLGYSTVQYFVCFVCSKSGVLNFDTARYSLH